MRRRDAAGEHPTKQFQYSCNDVSLGRDAGTNQEMELKLFVGGHDEGIIQIQEIQKYWASIFVAFHT